MLDIILVQGLTLLWLGAACKASSLGTVVHVVPIDSSGGQTVRAHFTVAAPNPCPDLSQVCATGDDCIVHPSYFPFSGTKPTIGWCIRQWQKTVASNYSATVNLGSNVNVYIKIKAEPKVRANNGRLNQPPYVALPPPLRARVKCPHHIHLSVRDLDEDKVRCRFARADQGECQNCLQHSFIELHEENCVLTFTGEASAGQYSISLMVEDMLSLPKINNVDDYKPLSSIPVQLSLTVEEASSSCSAEPVPTGQTPEDNALIPIVPYEQVDMTISFISALESVLEIAVVGPPDLFRSGLQTGSPTTMTMAWVRGSNKLAPLLPICFVANTNSLQSEPRCLWLYQREMKALPNGTVLTCDSKEMNLVLPVNKLQNINLSLLKLNNPNCSVTFNNTHLTARIPLTGCGTKKVHIGSELIYTNILQTQRPDTVITRQTSLILPLACRIPGVKTKAPQYKITMPSEKETFGEVSFWLEFHLPGEGPLANKTRSAVFRQLQRMAPRLKRQAADSNITTSDGLSRATSSKIDKLDLYVMSNCSIDRAELMIGTCIESETADFAVSQPILMGGCQGLDSTLEIITTQSNSKVYRLDLSSIQTKGQTMYMECTVYLCIATLSSQKCPDQCNMTQNTSIVVENVYTSTYKIRSEAISLVRDAVAPSPTVIPTPTTMPSTTTQRIIPTSHAPEEVSSRTLGLILVTIYSYHQNI